MEVVVDRWGSSWTLFSINDATFFMKCASFDDLAGRLALINILICIYANEPFAGVGKWGNCQLWR